MNETVDNTQIGNTRNGTGFILVLFGLIGIMVMFTEAMIHKTHIFIMFCFLMARSIFYVTI